MPSIQINDVFSKAYGKARLFQEVSVEFNEGKRYGLTGPQWRRQVDLLEDRVG